MKPLALLAFALTFSAPAFAQTPGETFAGLTGACWSADLGEGATDTHCFTLAIGGKLVMDVHKVRSRSGAVVYEGATLYRAESSDAIRYDYFNSNGDLLTGYARREADLIRFSDKPGDAGNLVWTLGPDAYDVAAGAAPSRRFRKIGPAGEGGF